MPTDHHEKRIIITLDTLRWSKKYNLVVAMMMMMIETWDMFL